MDWFLYDNGLRHEKLTEKNKAYLLYVIWPIIKSVNPLSVNPTMVKHTQTIRRHWWGRRLKG